MFSNENVFKIKTVKKQLYPLRSLIADTSTYGEMLRTSERRREILFEAAKIGRK